MLNMAQRNFIKECLETPLENVTKVFGDKWKQLLEIVKKPDFEDEKLEVFLTPFVDKNKIAEIVKYAKKIRENPETPLDYLTDIFSEKWEQLLEIIKNPNLTDKDLQDFLMPFVGEDKTTSKSAKQIHDIAYLNLPVVKQGLERYGAIPALDIWKNAVIMYISTAAEKFFEYKAHSEEKKLKTKKKPNPDSKEKDSSSSAAPPEKQQVLDLIPPQSNNAFAKITPVKSHEIETFLANEKIALAAINDADQTDRFTPDELFEISKKHLSFALTVCKNSRLLTKLPMAQLQILGEMYLEVTIFLASNYEMLGIENNIINALIFDKHYFPVNGEEVLNYLVSLATNIELYQSLSGYQSNQLLKNGALARYAMEHHKAFENADPQVFIHLIISYVKNYYSHSFQEKDISDQIISFLSNPKVVKAITGDELCQLLASLPHCDKLQIFNLITTSNELVSKIYYEHLLWLTGEILRDFRSSGILNSDQKNEILNAIKILLNKRLFFISAEITKWNDAKFKLAIALMKYDETQETMLLKALKTERFITAISSERLETLAENFALVFTYVIDNLLERLSRTYLLNLKLKPQLTKAQLLKVDEALAKKFEQEVLQVKSKYDLLSLGLSSYDHALAIIKTDRYQDFPDVDAGLAALFNKYPNVMGFAYTKLHGKSINFPRINALMEQRRQSLISSSKEGTAASSRPRKTSAADYDYLFKFRLIGDSGVGKSCLLLRYADDVYTDSYVSTIGIDFKIKILDIDDKTVKLQLWDTAGGQNPFKGEHRGAHAYILTFDLTDKVSFNNTKQYLREIEQHSIGKPLIILVGTKSDLEYKKVVDFQEASEFADSLGMAYFETSAKKNVNVNEMFASATKTIIAKLSTRNSQSNKPNSWSPRQFAPRSSEVRDIISLRLEFDTLFQKKKMFSNPSKITLELEKLRSKALELIKQQKDTYVDKESKEKYLNTMRELPIIKEHLYDGFGALFKNIGRTNALIQIDEWIEQVKKENLPELFISGPNNFTKLTGK